MLRCNVIIDTLPGKEWMALQLRSTFIGVGGMEPKKREGIERVLAWQQFHADMNTCCVHFSGFQEFVIIPRSAKF